MFSWVQCPNLVVVPTSTTEWLLMILDREIGCTPHRNRSSISAHVIMVLFRNIMVISALSKDSNFGTLFVCLYIIYTVTLTILDAIKSKNRLQRLTQPLVCSWHQISKRVFDVTRSDFVDTSKLDGSTTQEDGMKKQVAQWTEPLDI